MREHHAWTLHVAFPILAILLGPGAASAQLPYAEDFTGVNGSPWPAPWFNGSSHVTVQDLQDGRARLNGDPTWVSRMILPGFSETDVEVSVTFEFENVSQQGIGFYVRQNGGTLHEYLPHGQGYALFLKGAWGWPEDLGLWREIDGVETQFMTGYDPVPGGLQNGVRYRLRYRVTQQSPSVTRLQARVWPEGSSEPLFWTVEGTDTQPLLQNTPGSFAIDIYNQAGTSHVFIDDVRIERYPATTAVPQAIVRERLTLSAPRPHPVGHDSSIGLSLVEAGEVEWTLLDLAGREVARETRGRLGAGEHTISLASICAGLAPGVYHLVARSAEARSARRLVIAR